jgi:hypothetical protein
VGLADAAQFRVQLLRVSTVGNSVPLGFGVKHDLLVGWLELLRLVAHRDGRKEY